MKNAKIGHLFKSPKSTRISFGSFIAIDYIYLITSFLTTYLKIYISVLEITQPFNFIIFHVS